MKLMNIILISILISSSNIKYPSYITTPEKLSIWLQEKFTYVRDKKDIWLYPDEMLKKKKGDCEDYAFLTQYILTNLGYKSVVMYIHMRLFPTAHAITVFKDNEGWSYIDLDIYKKRKYKTIYDLMTNEYKNWGEICSMSLPHNYNNCIERN